MLPRVLWVFCNQRLAIRVPVKLLDFFFSQFQVSIRITFQNVNLILFLHLNLFPQLCICSQVESNTVPKAQLSKYCQLQGRICISFLFHSLGNENIGKHENEEELSFNAILQVHL